MDHRKLALLLALALSTACSLPPVKTGGYVAADGRVFVEPPKYAGQEQAEDPRHERQLGEHVTDPRASTTPAA